MTLDPALRIASLEALVAEQRARIEELERMLGDEVAPPPEWRLPRREVQIFSLLMRRERVTKDMLSTVFRDDFNEDTDPAVWESHISKMRKRLRPFGVQIESQRHLGYRLVDREKYRRAA